jgi:hypothetical protein
MNDLYGPELTGNEWFGTTAEMLHAVVTEVK